jgi:hypothetical protein
MMIELFYLNTSSLIKLKKDFREISNEKLKSQIIGLHQSIRFPPEPSQQTLSSFQGTPSLVPKVVRSKFLLVLEPSQYWQS